MHRAVLSPRDITEEMREGYECLGLTHSQSVAFFDHPGQEVEDQNRVLTRKFTFSKKDPSSSTSYAVVSFSRDREYAPSSVDGNNYMTSAVDISYSTVEEMGVLDDSGL